MTQTYNFEQQLAIGADGESILRAWLFREYDLMSAHTAEQMRGIDFIGVRRSDSTIHCFECKTDVKGWSTAFIETLKDVDLQKKGWALTCEADYLLYWARKIGVLFVLEPFLIQAKLPAWAAKYPTWTCDNATYKSQGLQVDFSELRRIAVEVHELKL